MRYFLIPTRHKSGNSIMKPGNNLANKCFLGELGNVTVWKNKERKFEKTQKLKLQ